MVKSQEKIQFKIGDRSQQIVQSYWLLGILQVIHSMEETYTKLYLKFAAISEVLHQLFPWFPLFNIGSDLFAILNYLIIGLMLGSIPIAEKGKHLGFIFMWSWAIVELLNGAFHIGTWLVLRDYFPGGISGPMLFVLSLLFIYRLQAISDRTIDLFPSPESSPKN